MSEGNYQHELTSNGNSYVTRCTRCNASHYYSSGPGWLDLRFRWIASHNKTHAE